MSRIDELIPLKISGGWIVEYNTFTYFKTADKFDGEPTCPSEDLLILKSVKRKNTKQYLIDLGWRGDHFDGRYILSLLFDNWIDSPVLIEYKSKNIDEIQQTINYWIQALSTGWDAWDDNAYKKLLK